MDNCFLSIDEDKPLAIWWADSRGCGVIPLDVFLEESKIDMSKEQAKRYADRLQEFIDELDAWSNAGTRKMHKYLAKTRPNNEEVPVTFCNPVAKGDLVIIRGERFIVFEVSHMDGCGSSIVCDRG